MPIRTSILAILGLLGSIHGLMAQSKTIAERLGYSADSNLLIIHADDLAVAHSEDAASFDALRGHIGQHHGSLPLAHRSRRVRQSSS